MAAGVVKNLWSYATLYEEITVAEAASSAPSLWRGFFMRV